MDIAVIIIGDELLLGNVADINTGEIARQCEPYGIHVAQSLTVGDDGDAIRRAVDGSLALYDTVIITGGLGPTKDDITKHTLCDMFGGKPVLDPVTLANVEEVMRRRNRPLNDLTRSQAIVPDNCKVVQNEVGTAPIMWFDLPEGKRVISMPGVPFETATMLRRAIVPMLAQSSPDTEKIHFTHRWLQLTGISESAVAERIAQWEDNLPAGFHLAYLPATAYLRLRLDGAGTDPDTVELEADRLSDLLTALLADYVTARSELTPAELLLDALRRRHLTVATAESCTGGGIAAALTAIPGSSEAVAGGIVAYCNEAKMHLLGVDEETLRTLGAVSQPVVEQMTRGARKAFGADIAIATSGIAGPGGATEGKPVGTICICADMGDGRRDVRTAHFSGDRARVTAQSINTALLMALRLIENGD